MGRCTVMRFAVIAATLSAVMDPAAWAKPEGRLPLARIAGVVVDESGAAVAGADVYVGNNREDATVADKDGKFLLELKHTDRPSVGYHDIVASAEGGRRLGLWSIQDVFEPGAEGKVVLNPALELHVKVTDAGHAPLPDTEVGVCFEGANSVFTVGKTDPTGNVILWMPKGFKLAWVVAIKRGAGLDYILGKNIPPGRDGIPLSLEMRLEGARRFVIEAKDSQERFVSGAEFFPWYLSKQEARGNDINLSSALRALPSLVSRTDKTGRAVVDWMPPNVSAQVPFLCRGEVWHIPQPPVYDPKEPKVLLSARLVANVELSGKVLLPDGKPAADMIVQAEGRGESTFYCRERAQTAADGSFSVHLYPEQSYIVTVVHKTWAVDSVTDLNLSEGDTPADVTLRLKKGTRVHGKVSPDPNALHRLGDVIVGQIHGRTNLIRWPDVDAAGNYEIFLGRGTYMFQMSRSDSPEHTVTITDEPELEINF